MNRSFSLSQLTTGFSRFLHRYHVVLFAIVVIGSLSIATLLLSNAMSAETNTLQPTSTVKPLDTKTMDKVDALRQDSTPLVVPGDKRTNPFN